MLLIDEIDQADEEFEAFLRLIASRSDALSRTDLRTLVTPEEAAEAERIAERLARAIRYRLTRRRTPARRGEIKRLKRRGHRLVCRARLRRLLCDRPLAGEHGSSRGPARASLIES